MLDKEPQGTCLTSVWDICPLCLLATVRPHEVLTGRKGNSRANPAESEVLMDHNVSLNQV